MARKKGKALDGIVLLDKPLELSSNQALQKVKRLFDARKAGHTGSLDPMATGLLPICFGWATKVSAFLLESDKTYRVIGRLGEITPTADTESEVVERRSIEGIEQEDIESVLKRFRGEVDQIPPMHSAVKKGGRKLYELAREGVEVEREARRITFHEIELESVEGADVQLRVHSSKGAYIRTLIEDLGKELGCGAHVVSLRRIGLAPFEEPRMYTLEELEGLKEEGQAALENVILPPDSALVGFPAVELDPDSAHYLTNGQAVFIPRVTAEGWVRLYGEGDLFLGMGEVLDDGRVAPRRLLSTA